MKLLARSLFCLLILASRLEARPKTSFFVRDTSGNGCGYSSCPAYNASAKVVYFETKSSNNGSSDFAEFRWIEVPTIFFENVSIIHSQQINSLVN
jgi:hypothetical protein